MEFAERLAAASRAFIDGLDESQVRAAVLPFDDAERRSWAYWPAPRRGISLSALGRRQAKAAHRLLATMLALPAYARAVTIMNLDEVLDRLENYASDRRHGGDYWMTVFGRPGRDRWGVRFEGHHVSVHATCCGGEVRLTPLFLGANPAIVGDGGRPVIAPLGPEEQLGFELLHAMTPAERAMAVLSDRAPDDIATRNSPLIDRHLPVEGVLLTALTGVAAAAARDLLAVYLGRFPAGARRPDDREARFAWAGADAPGIGHYYRIIGPRLLIEFDNTQNGANHIHTVVRDPAGDFGDDLLAAHHHRSHPIGG